MVLSALTNHGVVVGTGTGVTATATGATGVPLVGQGGSADPVFQATGVKIDSHFGAITADTDASTVTMDLSVSDWHTLLLTSAVGGNRTLALSNPTVGQQFAIVLQQPASGGPCTVTWFSGILWSGGTVPTLTTTASKRDVFGFKCISAGVYLRIHHGAEFLAMSNPYDLVVLADSPVSYWPLDEVSGTVANDLVGGNNGTYTGGFTLGQRPSSAFGGATTFNGTSGYVTVPDATNLRITGPITLEGWVFYTGLSTGSTNFPTLVQKYDGTTNGYALLNQPHDGGGLQDKPICYLFKSGSLSFQNSPTTMTTGGWHHIVATYDNVNPLIVYVDGIAVVSGNIGANKLGSNTSPCSSAITTSRATTASSMASWRASPSTIPS